ncbi:hypothetical protein TELCIR_20007, partial [Teladorsagia circumcincta]
FSALEGDRTRMLLTLLRVFSEEVQFSKVGENRRNEIRSELAASGASVIAYLSQVLEGYVADHDMIKKVLLCLSAYLQNPALSTDQFAASPLLNNVFQILAAPNAPNFLHDAATECAVSALVRAEDHHAHQALAMSLQAAVYQLHGAFNQAVAMEDMDKLQNFARIFVELAESLLEKIVNEGSDDPNSMGSINTLELLLLLAGHHDYSVVETVRDVVFVVGTEACVRSGREYRGSRVGDCNNWSSTDFTSSAFAYISGTRWECERMVEQKSVIPGKGSRMASSPRNNPRICRTSSRGDRQTCTVLIMNLPEDGIRQRLSEMCQPIIQRLQMVLSSTPVISMNNENEKAADSWARIAGEPVLWIDRIATIFREVRPWNGAGSTGFRDAGVEAAEDLVIHHGAKLIELCLTAAIFKVTGSLRRDLAEIVYMLSKIDRGRHKEWLITATSRLPRGPLAATDEQLEQFVANITA